MSTALPTNGTWQSRRPRLMAEAEYLGENAGTTLAAQ